MTLICIDHKGHRNKRF